MEEEVGDDEVFGENGEVHIEDDGLKDDVFPDVILKEIAETEEEQIDSKTASRRTVKFQNT